MSVPPTRVLMIVPAMLLAILLGLPAASPAGPPARIISLAPNLTEILFALGLEDRVVGVTQFCDYPAEARTKQKVGGMSNPSLEAVISLRPDLVLMTTDGNQRDFADRLRSLKIPTYVFTARRLADLPGAVRDLGRVLDAAARADAFSREMESALRDLRSPPAGGQVRSALFVIWPEPLIVAGPETVIDDAMKLIGLGNAASGTLTAYPKYSVEEILRRSPDMIFFGMGHVNVEKVSAGLLEKLKTLPAVKRGNIHFVSDDLYRLGPRSIRGIREIARFARR